MKFKPFSFCAILCVFPVYSVTALANPAEQIIGLEEVETSSSKKLIKRFESPASVSVLTAERIKRSGVTNISEALRLIPGLIVREQVNGQFDVSIRGLDNTPRPKFLSESNSRATLVMIDDRPVFDYFQGGVFWEALPVSIEDVEKIEVVRGAVASMYGPNAALGVIHIKTKRGRVEKITTSIATTVGNHGLMKQQLSLAGSNQHFFWRLGGEFEERERYESSYYNLFANEYQSLENLGPSRGLTAYPNPDRSQRRENVNFAIYNEEERLIHYDLSLFYQDSEVQKAYIASLNTPITRNDANSHAFNLKVRAYDWNLRLSQHKGNQKIIGYPELEYDFKVSQTLLEKSIRGAQWFVRPGIRYDEMIYKGDLLQGEQTLRNTSFFTRGEFVFSDGLKLTASGSIDQYSFPDDSYFSYEVGASKTLDSSTVIRMGIQRANRSSFMYNSFLDFDVALGGDPNNRLVIKGNKEVDLITIDSLEFGWRKEFSFYHSIDVEIFYNHVDDYSASVSQPTLIIGPQTIERQLLESIPTKVDQIGLTVDWKYESYNWDLNAFLTVQEARVTDQLQTTTSPLILDDETSSGSPLFYGGGSFNWRPREKWSVNTSLYILDDSTTQFIDFEPGYEQSSVALLNLSLHYQVARGIEAALAVKNLSNKKQSQFYYTEEIEPTLYFTFKASF